MDNELNKREFYFRIRFVDEDKAIIESVEYVENKETENENDTEN